MYPLYHLCVLSISLHFEHAYCVPHLAAITSCGWSFTEIARPAYTGVRKLRALCMSVIFAENSFRENPRNTHVRSEVKSTISLSTRTTLTMGMTVYPLYRLWVYTPLNSYYLDSGNDCLCVYPLVSFVGISLDPYREYM